MNDDTGLLVNDDKMKIRTLLVVFTFIIDTNENYILQSTIVLHSVIKTVSQQLYEKSHNQETHSSSGNRTLVSHVIGGDTNHYTNGDGKVITRGW